MSHSDGAALLVVCLPSSQDTRCKQAVVDPKTRLMRYTPAILLRQRARDLVAGAAVAACGFI